MVVHWIYHIVYLICLHVLAMYKFHLAAVSDFCLSAFHSWSDDVSPSKLRELMPANYISTACFNTILRSYVEPKSWDDFGSSMRRNIVSYSWCNCMRSQAYGCAWMRTLGITWYTTVWKNASLSCFGTIYSPMDRHCVQVLIGAWYREQNTRGEHPSLIGHRLSPHYMIRFH